MCRKLVCWTLVIMVLSLLSTANADLVGLWKLDDGSGTSAVDRSGHGHNGDLIGNPQWVDGLYGGALQFAGTPDKVDIPQSAELNPDDAFSATLWVNVAAGSSGYRSPLTSRDDGPQRGYIIYAHTSGYWSFWTGTGSAWNQINGPTVVAGEWTHLAITFDNGDKELYINGQLEAQGNAAISPNTQQVLRIGGGATEGDGNYFFVGTIDDVAVFNHALTEAEVLDAMAGVVSPEYARTPDPSNDAVDVPRDTALSWTPGKFAASHDIYFGTSMNDVNDASRSNPMGVLVSQGQAEASYQPTEVLDYDQTYYWRVDEVNAAPANMIYKGSVWRFTVEPFAYTVEGVVATSNTSSVPSQGPERLVDGSGLNDAGQHSTVPDDMWLGDASGDEPVYVQFEFDRVYKMYEMLIWNYNMAFEAFLGFGVKDATVEYSVDGIEWSVLGDVELAQAPGTSTYTYGTTVPLEGVAAKVVRLTVGSSWLSTTSHGLSEVRFTYIPAHAREPEPADGATDVLLDTNLSWRAGRDVVTHEVYLGTDPNALELAGTPTQASFDPALDLDTTYYWQVAETDAEATWEGALWSFTTQEFIVIDDFDSYIDDETAGVTIWEAWVDGLVAFGGDAANGGSQVGHSFSPFAEKTIVHTGSQSMPLYFSNAGASAISEADYAITPAQNWTTNGVKSLSLWFYGDAANSGQLYVKINGTKVTYDGDASDIATGIWQPWNIDLATVGTNLSNVTELSVGVEGTGEGVVYIDDIRLYGKTPELAVPTQPSDANLVSSYALDGNFNDSVGGHNGTPVGGPEFTNDPARGQVLSLNGTTDLVDVEYSPELNPTDTFTVSVWANPDPAGLNYRSPVTSRDDGPSRGYIIYLTPNDTWQYWTGTGSGWNSVGNTPAELGEWVHIAVTFDNEQKELYLNGRLAGQGSAPLSPNTQRPFRIGAGATEGPGSLFFMGMIDEVSFYNVALTAGEIASLAGRNAPVHRPF